MQDVARSEPLGPAALFLAINECKVNLLLPRNPKLQPSRSCLWATIPLLLFHFTSTLMGESGPPPQILFLHLRLTNNVVVLLSTNVQPGVVKPQRHRTDKHALHCEVRSITGLTIWKAAVDHPQWLYLEYPDPENPGQMRRKEVRRETPDFTVRIPLQPDAETIEFYELSDSGPAKASRKIMGKIELKARSQ